MALGTIASKTYGTALEEDRNLVLEPGVAYQRLTSLPDGWRRARIAALMSFVGLTGANSAPVSENSISPWTPASLFLIGISNGQGLPGHPGVMFVGATMSSLYYAAIARLRVLADGTARLSYNGDSGSHCPGGVLFSGSATAWILSYTGFDGNHKPTASEGFCFGATVDVALGSDNNMRLRYQSSNAITDAALGSSVAITAAAIDLGTISGGWWGAAGYSGCRHLFIRCPFQQNRLRLHALRVMQLA